MRIPSHSICMVLLSWPDLDILSVCMLKIYLLFIEISPFFTIPKSNITILNKFSHAYFIQRRERLLGVKIPSQKFTTVTLI